MAGSPGTRLLEMEEAEVAVAEKGKAGASGAAGKEAAEAGKAAAANKWLESWRSNSTSCGLCAVRAHLTFLLLLVAVAAGERLRLSCLVPLFHLQDIEQQVLPRGARSAHHRCEHPLLLLSRD